MTASSILKHLRQAWSEKTLNPYFGSSQSASQKRDPPWLHILGIQKPVSTPPSPRSLPLWIIYKKVTIIMRQYNTILDFSQLMLCEPDTSTMLFVLESTLSRSADYFPFRGSKTCPAHLPSCFFLLLWKDTKILHSGQSTLSSLKSITPCLKPSRLVHLARFYSDRALIRPSLIQALA